MLSKTIREIISLFLILLMLSLHGHSQSQYSPDYLAVSDILSNTFWIQTDTGTATAFIIKYREGEYLITAKHVFKKNDEGKSKISIKININMRWKEFSAKIYFHEKSNIDVAVLKLNTTLSSIQPLDLMVRGISIGESCAFFGFPYGIFTNGGDRVYAFVKRAYISSFSGPIIFLDGMNNPGFSGGPVVVWDPIAKKPKIFGVISGYYPQTNEMDLTITQKKERIKYVENSGIIYSYSIGHATEIIDKLEKGEKK